MEYQEDEHYTSDQLGKLTIDGLNNIQIEDDKKTKWDGQERIHGEFAEISGYDEEDKKQIELVLGRWTITAAISDKSNNSYQGLRDYYGWLVDLDIGRTSITCKLSPPERRHTIGGYSSDHGR